MWIGSVIVVEELYISAFSSGYAYLVSRPILRMPICMRYAVSESGAAVSYDLGAKLYYTAMHKIWIKL